MKGIGLFLVGGEESFSRLFSQAQQEEYETLLKDYIVKIYLSKFRQYQTGSFSPDDFKVVQVTKDNPENLSKPWLVTTTVTIPGQREPLNLQWKVFHTPHGLRILDVIVEKFSMTQTKRDEFRSILLNRRADGGVAGLLNQLRAVKPAE